MRLNAPKESSPVATEDADPTEGAPCPRSWSLPAQTVVERLDVDPTRGLSDSAVLERRSQHGRNRLRELRPRSAGRVLWDQLASPIVALLSAATLVAFVFDERVEAMAIAAVLVLNTAIGFWTEWRALRAMDALRQLGSMRTTVRRDGEVRRVPADELVPGDIVLFDAGDVLTADLRLVAASRLEADESTLTGESLAVAKAVEPNEPTTALPDRSSMLFKGTAITHGSGEGVVVATGMATELGRISRLVEEAEAEVTPLEARLDRLGRGLLVLTLAIAVAVAAASIAAGRELYLSIEIALALAVAAVPEGLPIVATVALARGMARMARRNALVENLGAVETLGSTSVLLVDKTGTLTENRMVVGEIALGDEPTIVYRRHDGPGGRFERDARAVEPGDHPALLEALRIGALCNNAELATTGGADGVGDPTEVALLACARSAGLDRSALLASMPELREIAFDSEQKRMATLHGDGDAVVAAVKGAPETVIPDCTELRAPDGSSRPLTDADRDDWLERAHTMAARGHRVLALAVRRLDDPEGFRFEALTLVALIGLVDPPRIGVREAIDACRSAGIRVVMVTGDHGGTATHIAAATGLVDVRPGETIPFVDARALPDLEALPDPERDAILAASVVARATPRQKLQMITLLQRQGAVVAMTGDGVNDAPALKKADIGVAMGRRGTQVAREAADMVLRDDELGTIVAAVEQGRAIFSNIRKFVIYLLSCNLSEILAVTLAVATQMPLPLLPLQILFLNLVTDVFPALALGVGEGDPQLMRSPPRDSGEALIARRHWLDIVGFGSVIALSVLGALELATLWLEKARVEATTIAFVCLALAQLWHVFGMREVGSGWLSNEVTRNPWIWGALGVCLALVGLAVLWPPLATLISATNPGLDGALLALAMSAVPFAAGQILLGLRRAQLGRSAAPDG